MAQQPSQQSPLYAFDKMLAYLEGRLEDAEQREMEKLLERDEDFADQMDFLQLAWIRNPNLKEEAYRVHAQMGEFLKKKSNPNRKNQFPGPMALMIAAAFLIVWALYILIPKNPCRKDLAEISSTAGLYAQQYLQMSSRPQNQEEAIQQAFLLYDAYSTKGEGDLKEIINRFERLLDTTQQSLAMREMTMCLAVAMVLDGQSKNALPYLEKVESFAENRYRQEAHWYRALVLRELGETDRARQSLQLVIDDNSHYSSTAKKLLDCLND